MKTNLKTGNERKTSFSAMMILLVLLVTFQYPLHSQPSSTYFQQSEKSKFNYSLGLSMTQLPRSVMGEEVGQIPMLNFGSEYNINEHSSLSLKLASCYLSNFTSLGYSRKFYTNKYTFSLNDELGCWFGVAKMSGFNSNAFGIMNTPKVNVKTNNIGLNFSLSSGANFSLYSNASFNGTEMENNVCKFKGAFVSLSAEQPLYSNVSVELTLKMNYTELSHHAWLVFSEKSNKYLMPELALGINF